MTIREDTSIASWVDPTEMLQDPYPTYARLRREAPVAYVPQLNRYFLTRFRDCFDAEMDQETFSSFEREERSTMIRSMGRPMLRKDDPEHKNERNAMSSALRPVTIKKHWREGFERTAQRHIERMREIGPGVDMAQEFSVPFAADNLAMVLGLDGVSATQMMDWSHTLIHGTSNVNHDPEVWVQTDRVCAEIDEAIDRALVRVEREPDASIISAMHQTLADDALRANVRLTISGGMNEPSHVISSAVWALSVYPDQREAVLSDRRTWRDVFEETARFLSPVGMYPRRTTHDVEVSGITIPENSTVSLIVASANRDESQFTEPDTFDLDRESTSHLAFGNGTHICAGNWVARSMVGEVALPMLYKAFPNLEVIDPDGIDFHGWVFRGPRALPVSWS